LVELAKVEERVIVYLDDAADVGHRRIGRRDLADGARVAHLGLGGRHQGPLETSFTHASQIERYTGLQALESQLAKQNESAHGPT
jgi:hypothetical protein